MRRYGIQMIARSITGILLRETMCVGRGGEGRGWGGGILVTAWSRLAFFCKTVCMLVYSVGIIHVHQQVGDGERWGVLYAQRRLWHQLV